MAVVQYIGARYVPKIFENPNGSSDWLSGVSYEPLIIVTYAGNSFTSKKPVPATIGNPPANPEYWVSTGIYNQQIAELYEQVQTMDGEIDDIQGDITTLQTAAAQIPGMQTQLSALAAEVENDNNPVLLVLGDSWAAFSEGFENWGTLITEKTGYTVISYAVGGTGWYHRGGSDVARQGNFTEQLAYAVANMTAQQKARVKKIVVIGGVNDLNTTSGYNVGTAEANISTAMGTFVSAAHTNFPGVPVYAAINAPFYRYKQNDMFASRAFCLEANLISKHMPTHGIIPVQNMNWLMYVNGGSYRIDYLHPSATGAKVVGTAILAAIEGGSIDAYFSNTVTNWAIASNVIVEWNFAFKNGILTIAINRLQNDTSDTSFEVNYPDSGWGIVSDILHLIRTGNFSSGFNGNGAHVGYINWGKDKVYIRCPANAVTYYNSIAISPISAAEN